MIMKSASSSIRTWAGFSSNSSVRQVLILSLFTLLTLAGCTGLYSNLLGQDDPDRFVQVEPEYYLPLPYISRIHFMLSQGVGGRFSHEGWQTWAFDWTMPERSNVHAARNGTVVAVREEPEDKSVSFNDRKANYIRIRHEDGTLGVYAHLSKALVEVGDKVETRDVIALSGNTGYSTYPHLHFHVEKDGQTIPIAFFDVEDPGGIPRAGKLYQGRQKFN